ncbi:hypothetical protein EFV37_22065 [Mesorhizobium loti]|uniref:Uncharacterized protein n=1 Tax=Mesorhizobium jarvisii TaxID=1777867 RepID=A0A6M7TIE3_9HYPH|nr:hypothetical protein [Mesorhizobium jarvisii]OBQ59591.1 hypothetical protein A9K72_25605 [Mesorhizobium loti]QKC64671.1 hypothetical protein EB229_22060 [Mesorhizobium jarvisii]QKD10585.1 hypothetical protein EFV37_22065 [Mesorhizobium loti]RJT30575.1 hypothetical protein D3242_24695 [Mesorhizobium jarvisii]
MPVPELMLQRRKEILLLKPAKRFRQCRRLTPAILKATNCQAIGLWPPLATRRVMEPGFSWGTYNAQTLALWKGLRFRLALRMRNRKTRRGPPVRPGKRRLHSHSRPGLHKRKRKS